MTDTQKPKRSLTGKLRPAEGLAEGLAETLVSITRTTTEELAEIIAQPGQLLGVTALAAAVRRGLWQCKQEIENNTSLIMSPNQEDLTEEVIEQITELFHLVKLLEVQISRLRID
jgi:phage shock protein A